MNQISSTEEYNNLLKLINIKNTPDIIINNIYNSDCKKLIDKMIKSNIIVDAIITDPPYNISRKNNFKTIGRRGIDFGYWDKNFNQLDWLNNIDKILSKNGSLIIFNDWKNMGEISSFLETKNFIVKDLIRIVKPNPMPRNVNRRYVTDYEFALWAVKKKSKWTFNKEKDKNYLKPEYIGSVSIGNKRIHPTQKPKDAIINIIKTHTNIGDLIFDPFSGSGEISYRAYELNRNFISCEINKKYYSDSIKRFDNLFVKPAFNHIGNKHRIIKQLFHLFPKNKIDDFVDVFAGSGIVSSYAKFAKKIYMNEKDKNVHLLLELLTNTNENKLIKEVKKIIKKYNLPTNKFIDYKEQYKKLKDDFNYKDKNIYILFVLILYGFNMQIRFNSLNQFNIPAGKFFWTDYQEKKIIDFVKSFKTNIKSNNISLHNLDFEDFINDIDTITNNKSTLYFFDPPYLITDATYNNLWNIQDEKRLYANLNKMISQNKHWILTNQLVSKGKVNQLLLAFIIENENNIEIYNINTKFTNSNYQRKNFKSEFDLEIIVKSTN